MSERQSDEQTYLFVTLSSRTGHAANTPPQSAAHGGSNNA
jgi:hypothetical protein